MFGASPSRPRFLPGLRSAALLSATLLALDASRLTADELPVVDPARITPEALPHAGSAPGAAAGTDAAGTDAPKVDSVAAEGETPPTRPVGELDTVVVLGRQIDEEAFLVPYTVRSLAGDRVQNRSAFRSFPEMLREIPGVGVQRTGPGQGSPFLRGFTGFHTVLLVDGIRLNHAVLRPGPNQYWATLDPLSIDRIEVLLGPASVLYGSDAIGGAVNAITRSPRLGSDGMLVPGGRLHYRYAGAERSHAGRVEGEAGWDGVVGALVGFTRQDFGDLSAGGNSGELPNTGYDQYDGDAKVSFLAAPELEMTLAFQRSHQEDAPRTHSTIFSKSFRGTAIGSDLRRDLDQTRTLLYAQALWTPESEALTEARFSLSWHRHEETENRVRSNGRLSTQGFDDDVLGIFARFESPSPVGTLSYGVEYYRDFVDSFFSEFNADGSLRTRRSRGPVADDASYDLLGAYLQDVYSVTDDLEFTLGGRFQWAHARASDVDVDPNAAPETRSIDESWTSAVGSLRGLYRVLEEWNVFAGVSQGFRAPNLSDLTRFDTARSGEVEIPAPGLDPEEFIQLETGTKVRVGGFEAGLSYHYTFIDDMILRFPTGGTLNGDPVVTKANVGDGFIHGVELSCSWLFWSDPRGGDLTALASAGWQEGRVENFDDGVLREEAISKLPPLTAYLGLRWESADRRFWAEGLVTIADNQDQLSSGDITDTQRIAPGGTPGYTIYTLRAGARVCEGGSLFASIENITDKDYRVHGSGQNEVGTNAILGFDWRH